jgi:HK97 family phage prohead protease
MKTPNLPDRETRFLTGQLEIRAASETEKPRVRGYAAKFDSESENLGNSEYQFREIIAPGAFDEVLNDDVRALFNHDPNLVLARSKGGEGTLTIGQDTTGLWYEFDAPDTQTGRDLMENIRLGNVDQSSFGFTVAADGQKWEEKRDGDGPTIIKRTITKISRLFDVSPVTYPAYPDATVAIRSLTDFQKSNHEPEKPEPIDATISIRHWQRRADSISKPAL